MDPRLLIESSDWNFEQLEILEKMIGSVAQEFGLSTYPNQIEIISSEQMMEAYSSTGMPLGYPHWSFGKQYLNLEKHYKRGNMGLAYEIVINSNPCITYLLEENTLAMQALVIAHAAFGHNSFFKNNYLFQVWTSADAIIDYLVFAKGFIQECEERYGIDAVESLLDSCHALMNQGVDRYRRSPRLSLQEEQSRQSERAEYLQSQVNTLWKTVPKKKSSEKDTLCFPEEPEENLLYFIEKNAPLLEPWQREVIRIVRKLAQYFYPQRQTKVLNEGWACFWHYTIMNTLFERKLISESFMMEFLHHHTNVIHQLPFHSPHYTGLNPYALGFAIFQDLKRICDTPTAEDKQWFPDLVHTPWIETLQFAMKNFKDDSFIAQYLSPQVIRNLKLFTIVDEEERNELLVSAIHDEQGYQIIREALSQEYNLANQDPNIQIYNVNLKSDRALNLRYYQTQKRPLSKDCQDVLKHLHKLWGFPIKLDLVTPSNTVHPLFTCSNS